MELNIEIAKILDKYVPSDGVGTEREKLRMNLMSELLMVVNKLPIHNVRKQSKLLLQTYKEGFNAATESLINANELVKAKDLQ